MNLRALVTASAFALACACTTVEETETEVAEVAETAAVEAEANTTDFETTNAAGDKVADFEKADYSDTSIWLCHPEKEDDVCSIDLTTTVVAADGTTTTVPMAQAEEPEIDCFYIYPTVSRDETPNSDLVAGPEEINVTEQQFARFSSMCRTFAPMYRQITLPHLRAMMAGGKFSANDAMRMSDVKRAWKTYMNDYNDGRGVILVGHSQGSNVLDVMINTGIISEEDRKQIISVMPIGFPAYPNPQTGEYIFPPCEAKDQTACMINYMSFRGNKVPPSYSRFGVSSPKGERSLCVNPAVLSGDEGKLDAYMPARTFPSPDNNNFGDGVEVDTKFVALPGMLTAECRQNDTHTWLAIDVEADPADARADDIAGDVYAGENVILEDWGLHLIDVNLTMGNLLDIAEAQKDAWLAENAAE